MYNIKFSENYYKLPLPMPFEATLMQIVKINYNALSKCFIAYDTEHKNGAYDLPKTDLIILILLTRVDDEIHIFTTIRRFTPEKWKFYKSLEGESVGIAYSKDKEPRQA